MATRTEIETAAKQAVQITSSALYYEAAPDAYAQLLREIFLALLDEQPSSVVTPTSDAPVGFSRNG